MIGLGSESFTSSSSARLINQGPSNHLLSGGAQYLQMLPNQPVYPFNLFASLRFSHRWLYLYKSAGCEMPPNQRNHLFLEVHWFVIRDKNDRVGASPLGS